MERRGSFVAAAFSLRHAPRHATTHRQPRSAHMLKDLTRAYVAAFNAKDETACAALMADDFALEDPVVKRVEGRAAVMEAVRNIFNSCNALSFVARNIYQDGDTTLIEFVLTADGKVLTGVDVIEWQGNKMKELRAYLDV
jgi:ketosteroid isomerase-like protein